MKPSSAPRKVSRPRKARTVKPAVAAEFPALTLDANQGGYDYTLRPDATGCWVTVGNVSVHIVRELDGLGVRVDLLPKGDEMADPIDGAFAPFAPAAPSV